MRNRSAAAALCTLLALAACSSGEDEAEGERDGHVWEGQKDALDKARAVEQQILDAAGQRKSATTD